MDRNDESGSTDPDGTPPEPAPPLDQPVSAPRPAATVRIDLERRRDDRPPRGRDTVATEEPLEIRLRHTEAGVEVERRIAVTMRTPGDDFDLAVGFLYSEAVIARPQDVVGVTYCTDARDSQRFNVVSVALREGVTFDADRLERNFFTTSSCGVCGKASLEALEIEGQGAVAAGPTISARTVRTLPDRLRESQDLFERTGGIHASGLFLPDGTMELMREDVGRHNALDKVVGALFQRREIPASERVAVVSGRASFELVQKAVRAGIPILAAVGAPSSLAVETAERFGATLLGFVGPRGFNIYTGADRITD